MRTNVIFAGTIAACLFCSLSFADESAQPSEYVVHCAAVDSGFHVSLTTPSREQEIVFRKEPTYEGAKILRGVLPTAKDKSGYTGYACDLDAAKLYVDANRNLDLTDDPEAVYSCKKEPFISHLAFDNVVLLSGPADNLVSHRAQLTFMVDALLSMEVVSGWRGEFDHHGAKWVLYLADNLDGEIDSEDLLLLERVRDDNPDLADLNVDATDFPALKNVFFDGYDHTLDFSFHEGLPQISVKEASCPTGKLAIEGEHIKFLVLNMDERRAILDAPEGSVTLPAGNFYVNAVYVLGDKSGAKSEILAALSQGGRLWRASSTGLTGNLPADGTATLKCGAPLRNTITAERFANRFDLAYKLMGAGGETYSSDGSRFDPPRFAAYRGDRKIASGTFEYG